MMPLNIGQFGTRGRILDLDTINQKDWDLVAILAMEEKDLQYCYSFHARATGGAVKQYQQKDVSQRIIW